MDKRRFESLWKRCVTDDASGDGGAMFEELKGHYEEPHRRYHTPAHVDHCLRQFDAVAGEMSDPDAVEMAIWFHDVIYESRSATNERDSADLFLERTRGVAGDGFRDKVESLIMVTVHRELPESVDERFIVDIDLSSFGLPWDEFLRDSVAVRDEFPHMPDEEFYPKQRDFLASLLNRPRFCFTDTFRERHEAQARSNISGYLESLSERGLI